MWLLILLVVVFFATEAAAKPYPLAAPGGIGKIASPKVFHRIAANLRAPSSSLAGLPQAPEASFRTVASEWVTPHSYHVFGRS